MRKNPKKTVVAKGTTVVVEEPVAVAEPLQEPIAKQVAKPVAV